MAESPLVWKGEYVKVLEADAPEAVGRVYVVLTVALENTGKEGNVVGAMLAGLLKEKLVVPLG